MCWGDKIDYGNGKLCFSNLCPIQNIGMPKGYLCNFIFLNFTKFQISLLICIYYIILNIFTFSISFKMNCI